MTTMTPCWPLNGYYLTNSKVPIMAIEFVHSFDAKPSAHTICSMERWDCCPRSFPCMEDLDSFKQAGMEPSLLWMIAILRRFPVDPAFGAPFTQGSYWPEIVGWANANAACVESKFLTIPAQYRLRNPGFVIADLDYFTLNEETAIWLCQGLLAILLMVRDAPNFHITVVFHDPDRLLWLLEFGQFDDALKPLLRKLRKQLKKVSKEFWRLIELENSVQASS